jgi:hypothetical protein
MSGIGHQCLLLLPKAQDTLPTAPALIPALGTFFALACFDPVAADLARRL